MGTICSSHRQNVRTASPHKCKTVHTMAAHQDEPDAGLKQRDMLREAEDAADEEKSMSVRETFRYYKKAVVWSVVLSTALIMEGYDVSIVRP